MAVADSVFISRAIKDSAWNSTVESRFSKNLLLPRILYFDAKFQIPKNSEKESGEMEQIIKVAVSQFQRN